jgi:hypothetical protein
MRSRRDFTAELLRKTNNTFDLFDRSGSLAMLRPSFARQSLARQNLKRGLSMMAMGALLWTISERDFV